MMRRIELLPEAYLARQRQRRTMGLIVVAGLAVLLLLLLWWIKLGFDVTDAKNRLAEVQAENQQLQNEIAELAPFAELQREVQLKRDALVAVMTGDIDWPVLMTEVAMAVPGEVWLDSMIASAGTTEGSSPVGTETATVDISAKQPLGRIAFAGNSLSMPGVAKWLIRQEISKRFEAVFLSDATKGDLGGTAIFNFDSTLELNQNAASGRFTTEGLEGRE